MLVLALQVPYLRSLPMRSTVSSSSFAYCVYANIEHESNLDLPLPLLASSLFLQALKSAPTKTKQIALTSMVP